MNKPWAPSRLTPGGSLPMSPSRNIAIITGQLVVGGAERQLYLWLAHLDRERFNPIVITLHPGYGDYWEKPVEALGIPLYRNPRSINRLSRFHQILAILKDFKPDLIHGWNLFSGVYAAASARILGAKSLCGIRNSYQTFAHHKLLSILGIRFADGFVVNSNSAAADLQSRLGRKKSSVYVIPNAIQSAQAERAHLRELLTSQYQLRDDYLWCVSMGRMEASKHFEDQLELIADLGNKAENIHLLLFGDGPERPALERTARELGILDRVTFTGEVPQAGQWLPAFDLFVFTSLDEGMPNVILEAAAAGLPILTWDLPFYREILENERSGLLVESGNLQKLEEALSRLIASPKLRSQLGREAQSHVLREFSLERYIQNMTAAYEDLLGEPPAGSGDE